MKQLYTPWRMSYIKGEKKVVDGCVFCHKVEHPDDDMSEFVIARCEHVYVTLNRFPYTNGHVMVVPYEHMTSQEELPDVALTDLILTVNKTLSALRKLYNPDGLNIGANIGSAAGAGIAQHYHFHIVPRWNGDSNFMSVVGETRLIPDELETTYTKLKQVWNQLHTKDES